MHPAATKEKSLTYWANEWEINDWANQWDNPEVYPVIAPAVRYLCEFVNMVNHSSDGWPYWRPAGKAAGRLCHLLYLADLTERTGRVTLISQADVKVAVMPMKAFITRNQAKLATPLPRIDI